MRGSRRSCPLGLRSRLRFFLALGLAALGASAVPGISFLLAAGDPVREVRVSDELKVAIDDGEEILLSARPLPSETVDAFVRRLTDDPRTKREILGQNAGIRLFHRDAFVQVPYRLLSDVYKKVAIEALFPEDRGDPKGWTHVVSSPVGRPESLWRIAEWFTGDGANYRVIRAEGGLASVQTERGQSVRIPARLLLPSFRAEAAAGPVGTPASEEPPLSFARDAQGRYAIYRLRRGEALYSAVVVRFTGRVHAEDVNAKATEIAARSGIADVRSIPVDYPVKIPVEDLAADFKPPDDPERIEAEKARLETSQFVNRVRAARLSGVTFVLDAGHGGRDTGASVEGMEEARHVYDLACRVESLLRQHTKATVVLTVQGATPCRMQSSEPVVDWRTAQVQTHPPYPIEDTVAGVNLRWYLANAVLKRSEKEGGSEDKTVFVSLHADSLHPAVRGLMVYIPGEKFLTGKFGRMGEIYASRREVREASLASFSRKERIKAEGVSRDFAERIVAAFRADGLPLHAFQPIRVNVIRGGKEWVPAILRYNRIPARVLLEICNLNNPEDRKLLATRDYRDRVARALVSALVAFYGGPPAGADVTAGKRRP